MYEHRTVMCYHLWPISSCIFCTLRFLEDWTGSGAGVELLPRSDCPILFRSDCPILSKSDDWCLLRRFCRILCRTGYRILLRRNYWILLRKYRLAGPVGIRLRLWVSIWVLPWQQSSPSWSKRWGYPPHWIIGGIEWPTHFVWGVKTSKQQGKNDETALKAE